MTESKRAFFGTVIGVCVVLTTATVHAERTQGCMVEVPAKCRIKRVYIGKDKSSDTQYQYAVFVGADQITDFDTSLRGALNDLRDLQVAGQCL